MGYKIVKKRSETEKMYVKNTPLMREIYEEN
jgi:hypothetical protein